MEGYKIEFNIYAENEQEAKEAQAAIINFICQHAINGRAVTGRKIADALNKWDSNPIVKREIIKYFS